MRVDNNARLFPTCIHVHVCRCIQWPTRYDNDMTPHTDKDNNKGIYIPFYLFIFLWSGHPYTLPVHKKMMLVNNRIHIVCNDCVVIQREISTITDFLIYHAIKCMHMLIHRSLRNVAFKQEWGAKILRPPIHVKCRWFSTKFVLLNQWERARLR